MEKKKQNKNEHKTKSIIVYRKKSKEDDQLSCFISLFDMNNPHLLNECPKKILEFDKVNKVLIRDLNVDYLLPGNDLVINNLERINITKKENCINLSGKQKK